MTKRSFPRCDALVRTQYRLAPQCRQHLGSSRRQRAANGRVFLPDLNRGRRDKYSQQV